MALSNTARRFIRISIPNSAVASEVGDAIDAKVEAATDITLNTATAGLTTSYAKALIAEIYNNLKAASHFA